MYHTDKNKSTLRTWTNAKSRSMKWRELLVEGYQSSTRTTNINMKDLSEI